MRRHATLIAVAGILAMNVAAPQEPVTLKAALVALTDDAQVRAVFEDGLAAKARERDYDAISSYSIVPEVSDVGRRSFIRRLRSEGVGAVLMMSPAAVGAGSSLEAVRSAVSPNVYSDMRRFARQVSPSGGNDLFAVVHLAIYLIDEDGAEPISTGAVWLDEEPESQEKAIDLLQDLVLGNVDAVRAPIRQHLRMPPLQ